MKAFLIALLLALAAAAAGAAEKPAITAPRLTVRLQGQQCADLAVLNQARGLATSMFAEIGVRLDWKAGRPPGNGLGHSPDNKVVVVRLAVGAHPDSHEAAPGYAVPYSPSGMQATVFYDRAVPPGGDRGVGAAFLAHVLVHEIGHVLQGTGRHSEAGVMKPHWDRRDRAEMRNGHLRFTPYDIELIHSALVTEGK